MRAERYVYFIEAEGLSRLKIGIARDPAKRIRELQTSAPAKLHVRATLASDNAAACEAWLHRQFGPHRTYGEWFRFTPRLKRLVRALSAWPMVAHYEGRFGGRPTITSPAIPGRSSDELVTHAYAVYEALEYGIRND